MRRTQGFRQTLRLLSICSGLTLLILSSLRIAGCVTLRHVVEGLIGLRSSLRSLRGGGQRLCGGILGLLP